MREKNTFNRWGLLMQIILVKLTLYVTEKSKKKKKKNRNFTVSFPKLKRMPPPPPPKKKKKKKFPSRTRCKQAGPCPTFIGLLLRFYNNVQTKWQLCRL